MEEKRKIEQKEILDEKGLLEYTIIPNYKEKKPFLTNNEIKLYKTLKKIAYELKLTVFTQVALNRIIEVNNERKNQQLFNRICSKSIDFILYDEEKNKIKYCIELNDKTHNNIERKERDIFLEKIFKLNDIKLIYIKTEIYYNIEKIKALIKEAS